MKEKEVVKSCKDYLEVLKRQGNIVWWDRLNSGCMTGGNARNRTFVRGCKAGTPDLYCIKNDGDIVWIECKNDTYKLSEHQVAFKLMAEGVGHLYIIARSANELREKLK